MGKPHMMWDVRLHFIKYIDRLFDSIFLFCFAALSAWNGQKKNWTVNREQNGQMKCRYRAESMHNTYINALCVNVSYENDLGAFFRSSLSFDSIIFSLYINNEIFFRRHFFGCSFSTFFHYSLVGAVFSCKKKTTSFLLFGCRIVCVCMARFRCTKRQKWT